MKKHVEKFGSQYFEGVAHRGLHDENLTENGLGAFQNAIEHGMAFELDVHLAKDGELIVCHDGNLKRTTGKDGQIEALTSQEIRENYRLLDGGVVPTFTEVLSLNKERQMIVVELKVENRNYKELGKAVKAYFQRMKYDTKKYVFISFDPRALLRVKNLGIPTALLVEYGHKWVFRFVHLFDSVDIQHTMLSLRRVQRYARKHIVNCWTVNSAETLSKVSSEVDTVTFEHLPPDLVKETLKSKNSLQNKHI